MLVRQAFSTYCTDWRSFNIKFFPVLEEWSMEVLKKRTPYDKQDSISHFGDGESTGVVTPQPTHPNKRISSFFRLFYHNSLRIGASGLFTGFCIRSDISRILLRIWSRVIKLYSSSITCLYSAHCFDFRDIWRRLRCCYPCWESTSIRPIPLVPVTRGVG